MQSSPVKIGKGREAANHSSPEKPISKEARRLYEFSGFLLGVLGLVLILCLASYQPADPSFNTSTSAASVHNWIGPVGSYTADALLQAFGWVAYLIPLLLFIAGARFFRVRPFESPWTKVTGCVLLMGSLTALLQLFPATPRVYGLIHGSGIAGTIIAAGLVDTLNPLGATIFAATVFVTSLFLMTKFSFSSVGETVGAWGLSFARPVAERLDEWREARESRKRQRRLAREKVAGKKPITLARSSVRTLPESQAVSFKGQPQADETRGEAGLNDEGDNGEENEIAASVAEPAVVLTSRELRKPEPAASASKIAGRGSQSYKLPSTTLLHPPEAEQGIDEDELKVLAQQLTAKFREFGVTGSVTQIHPGPVVTTFEFKPEAGIKYSRITNLVDDLCLGMKAESILIERIPGKSTVGIEVPNLHREIIYLREIIESSEFAGSPSRLTVCLGKDITGKTKVGDLDKMPHLLIAGSTGSGKSVAINSMIVSMLYKSTPDEVKLILIDPKRLELNLYDGIPHLFTPIVTEPKVAANVLRRATLEMEERLKKLAQHGVRNIEQYNRLFEPESTLNLFDPNGVEEKPLPYLVIVIDELADLMMVEPQNVEESITRLAQMARAVGIHLILATQRPSVDVITGLIKANLPSRISFRVASKVDSRTILDSNGSEALLGRGDMLFMPPASARLVRLHGSFVTEKEINRVVEWWKSQSSPQYNEEFLKPIKDRGADGEDDEEVSAELDAVYEDAVRVVVESGKASTSLLQRRLRLGYGRAARLLDMMQRDGIISAPDGARPREVIKRPDWLQEVDETLR
ncbi:MAG TPA: DNA translocase FtsK [Terriglobia bacterium]|nr:DNA translocase FtsK [Terriglobia bacterium]